MVRVFTLVLLGAGLVYRFLGSLYATRAGAF